MNDRWLEPLLTDRLKPVAAPDELWDRVRAAGGQKQSQPRWWRAGALALAVGLLICSVIFNPLRRGVAGTESGDPVAVRGWIRAAAGMDVPIPAKLMPGLELEGARMLGREVEVQVRCGGQRSSLFVARADLGSHEVQHRFRKDGSWVMRGLAYRVSAADFRVSCLLCHGA